MERGAMGGGEFYREFVAWSAGVKGNEAWKDGPMTYVAIANIQKNK